RRAPWARRRAGSDSAASRPLPRAGHLPVGRQALRSRDLARLSAQPARVRARDRARRDRAGRQAKVRHARELPERARAVQPAVLGAHLRVVLRHGGVDLAVPPLRLHRRLRVHLLRMKAAILVESNKPLVVADVELPPSLSFGQVLVDVHYSGICGAQINEIEAAKGPDKFLPHLLGHEASATVVDIGPGVRTVQRGDRVVLHWRPGDGLQADPASYRWNGRTVNAGWVTTFQEKAVVSENRVTRIDPDFDLRLAPLFGCAVTTAMGVINRDAGAGIGQSVVVFGVGGVGVNIVQSAALASAYPIVAVDIVDSKLEWARRFGASHAFAAAAPDLAERIKAVVGPQGADVVVDTTGRARVI